MHCGEFSAVTFYENIYPSCNGLAEAIVAIFQGKHADIYQVIILQNVNLTWVGTVRATSFMRVPRSTVEFCPSKHRGLPKLSESLKSFEVYREVSTAQLRGTPCVSVEHRVPPWNLPWAYVADFLLNYIYATARLRGTPWASVEFTLGGVLQHSLHRVSPWNAVGLRGIYLGCRFINIPTTARLRGTPWASVEFTLGVGVNAGFLRLEKICLLYFLKYE